MASGRFGLLLATVGTSDSRSGVVHRGAGFRRTATPGLRIAAPCAFEPDPQGTGYGAGGRRTPRAGTDDRPAAIAQRRPIVTPETIDRFEEVITAHARL
ncbi:hypothetical protein [Streptomyces sp. NPDC001970]